MLLAPTPELTHVRQPSPRGRAGVYNTLALMRQMVDEGKTDPSVLQAAISIIHFTPEKDQGREVAALYQYVRDYIRYVQDVYGVETLCTPAMTLQRMVGDCDDQTMLLCALAEAVGYPTRFVAAKYQGDPDFTHVYCEIFAGGQWFACDPTEKETFGWEAPNPVSLYFEAV